MSRPNGKKTGKIGVRSIPATCDNQRKTSGDRAGNVLRCYSRAEF